MPSKPTEPRSISAQLVLLFTGAAALLFFCGLGILYWIVVQHAFEEDNEALADRLFAVQRQVHSGLNPVGSPEETPAQHSRERVSYLVRLIDDRGQVIAESPGMGRLLPPALFSPPAAEPKLVRKDGRLFALISQHASAAPASGLIQMAQDRSVDEQFTRRFGVLVIIVFFLGILATALLARGITRRGLRPLADITHSLERTGPTRLHERVEPTSWPREIQPLARAFDQMLDRLEDSFTRLSQFSADLAHELRTPIANLRGEAEVALTRPRSAEEYRAVLESSVAEYERLSGIIDNLLFLARADAAHGLAQPVTFDARAAVEKIAGYYSALAEERGIEIACHGQAHVDADPALFGRAISNLLENALRYAPDASRIDITLEEKNQQTRVSVQDRGPGIAPADLPRVFDRFYRADSSRSTAGTGLGLSLVKSIMNLHHGEVEIRTDPVPGTTAILSFPRDGKGQAPPPADSSLSRTDQSLSS